MDLATSGGATDDRSVEPQAPAPQCREARRGRCHPGRTRIDDDVRRNRSDEGGGVPVPAQSGVPCCRRGDHRPSRDDVPRVRPAIGPRLRDDCRECLLGRREGGGLRPRRRIRSEPCADRFGCEDRLRICIHARSESEERRGDRLRHQQGARSSRREWTQDLVLESGDRATPAAIEARLSRLEDIYANSLITEAEYRLRRETILRYLAHSEVLRSPEFASDLERTEDGIRTKAAGAGRPQRLLVSTR